MRIRKNYSKLLIILFTSIMQFSCQKHKNFDRPNILIIEVDDLTAKYLSAFGSNYNVTPQVDKLYRHGILFENAVTQAAMCTPSRNSLITAQYPHNLGLYHNLDLKELPSDIWTIPKALKNLGYNTLWIGKNHLIPNLQASKGLNRNELVNQAMKDQMGFDYVYQSYGRTMVYNMYKNKQSETENWTLGHDTYGDFLIENGHMEQFLSDSQESSSLDKDSIYMDGHFTTVALNSLKSYQEDKPFLLWLNFSGPHHPFDAPEEFQNIAKRKKIHLPIDFEPSNAIPSYFKPHISQINLNGIREYRRKYIASIAYMDEQVGRILNFIKSSDFADNTVIVFFSDHGIMTGNHRAVEKETLYQEVINPSLVFYAPHIFDAKREKKVVELLDLGKTLVNMAGGDSADLAMVPNGHDLSPLLLGYDDFNGRGYGFSECSNFRSIYDGSYKYIDHPTDPILFNLAQDPKETRNFIDQEKPIAQKLKQIMDSWLLETAPVLPPAKEIHPKI